MHVVTGRYHFRKKLIGIKNDFCDSCYAETVSKLWHSFEMQHIYWIPLIPLGSKSRWKCSRCGKDPAVSTRTSRSTLYAGAITFLLIALLLIGIGFSGEQVVAIIVLGAFMLILSAVMFYAAIKYKHTM